MTSAHAKRPALSHCLRELISQRCRSAQCRITPRPRSDNERRSVSRQRGFSMWCGISPEARIIFAGQELPFLKTEHCFVPSVRGTSKPLQASSFPDLWDHSGIEIGFGNSGLSLNKNSAGLVPVGSVPPGDEPPFLNLTEPRLRNSSVTMPRMAIQRQHADQAASAHAIVGL